MKVKSEREVTRLYPTLSDPMDYSLPGSSIHGIFQARVLEWGAIAFSRRRRGGIKRGESKLASNHFPMCSPQSGSLRDVHRVIQRREEEGRRQRWPGG